MFSDGKQWSMFLIVGMLCLFDVWFQTLRFQHNADMGQSYQFDVIFLTSDNEHEAMSLPNVFVMYLVDVTC